jgi:hypothetical protein
VHDLVEAAGGPARFDWLLHAHTEEAFPCDSAAGSFFVERSAAALQGQFLAPPGVRLDVAASFDIAPQQKRASVFLPWEDVQPEWTLTAAPAAAAPQTEFLAVMAVLRPDAEARFTPVPIRPLETPVARGCEVRTAYGRWLILCRRGDAPSASSLEAEGLRCDGQAAAVLLSPDGALLNAFAANATRLSWVGRDLFTSLQPATWGSGGPTWTGPKPAATTSRCRAGPGPVRPTSGPAAPPSSANAAWSRCARASPA